MENYYNEHYTNMIGAKDIIFDVIEKIEIESCKYRIKSESSVVDKLNRKGLDTSLESAINNLNDLLGIRVICAFLNNVFEVVEELKASKEIEILNMKDYITNPKPNGYRSFHLIVYVKEFDIKAEIQIRTIAQDCFAALEHMIMYKKDCDHKKMIQNELKRCADELASSDVSMQTIYELIRKANL